ncbi:esterase/lipase family protein [Inediibacterium massiliense]|uniref:esterase/lipase family protein n=1 Tax=Inediibacterium massiliense TaxID=1658111 RepID=UPI0006B4CE9C|nr:hypothetical protein [Inediibacterium massiliense]
MHPLLATVGMLELMRMGTQEIKKPIVFVPGLYGSMGEDIIPGTGEWGFGMAASVYEPFIEILTNMGYEKEKDLFICFYDWRKDCRFSSEEYLQKTIYQAKAQTRSKKVNLICHSMGGLVARAYVQGNQYGYDVDQLIFIGTPNGGSANAYYFWAGGELPYERNIKSSIFTTLLEGYLWILEKKYKNENTMEVIRKHLQGVKDLLPSKTYGNYLYYIGNKQNTNYISYKEMNYHNEFLDELNDKKGILKNRKIQVTLIGGKSINTNQKLQIDRRYKNEDERWKDGKVVGSYQSKEGDGTVLLDSLCEIEGDTYVFEATHTEILQRCKFILQEKLGIKEDISYKESMPSVDDYVSVLVSGKGQIRIKTYERGNNILLYDGTKRHKDIYVQKTDEKNIWILIKGFSDKHLYMEYTPMEKEPIEIVIRDHLGRKKKIQERKGYMQQAYKINLS